jgi:hypothetical protein
MRYVLTSSGLDRLQILQRNAQQILKIVTTAFPTDSFEGPAPNDCSDLSIDIERLSCEWKKIQHELKYMSFENRPRDFENMLKDITKVSHICSKSIASLI